MMFFSFHLNNVVDYSSNDTFEPPTHVLKYFSPRKPQFEYFQSLTDIDREKKKKAAQMNNDWYDLNRNNLH